MQFDTEKLKSLVIYYQVGRSLQQYGPVIKSTVTLLSFAMTLQETKKIKANPDLSGHISR